MESRPSMQAEHAEQRHRHSQCCTTRWSITTSTAGPSAVAPTAHLSTASLAIWCNRSRWIRIAAWSFLYARYNVDLRAKELAALGFADVKAEDAQKWTKAAADQIDLLMRIGAKAPEEVEVKEHFRSFTPAPAI